MSCIPALAELYWCLDTRPLNPTLPELRNVHDEPSIIRHEQSRLKLAHLFIVFLKDLHSIGIK